MAIASASCEQYAAKRQGEGAANGSINREFAVLGRMLRLAFEHGTLARVPKIRKLTEVSPRSGFVEDAQFQAIRRRLPEDLQAAVAIAFTYGWRRDEILTLQRYQLDLEAGTPRLDVGTTKNDDGREVDLLRPGGQRRAPVLGEPMRDFRRAWATACKAAGVPGLLKHDLRRSAVRRLVNGGLPERVTMSLTGHKTRAVFDRYHIVSRADQRAAVAVLNRLNGDKQGDNRRGRLETLRASG